MGILNLLSNEGRAAAKSKWEYEACYRARQETLLSFRKNAIQEILFKYPDARLLLNRWDDRFMVSIKGACKLLVGIFADSYYPRLDFVGQAASTNERSEAVARFLNEVNSCSGTISRQNMARFKNNRAFPTIENKKADYLQSRGFAITGSTRLDYLIGGALFLNEIRIAKASVWDPQPEGYFSTKIFEEVLQGGDMGPGGRALVFVTKDLLPCSSGEKMCYRIPINRSLQYFDASNREEFVATILNLRDFIYEIEEYFRPECPTQGEDRISTGWCEIAKHDAESLDSPHREDDQTIESRYIL